MSSRRGAYATRAKQSRQKKPSVGFMPEAPKVQSQVQAPQPELPKFNPDTSIFQTDLSNPYASLFGIKNPSVAASYPIQPKLTVGAVGDKYEQEADNVAAQVVETINQPQGAVQPKPSSESDALRMKPQETLQRESMEEEEMQMKPQETLQRNSVEEEEEVQMKPQKTLQRVGYEGGAVSSGLESQIQRAKGGGQSLDSGLKQRMGQAMGADFSGVKVHTDSQSDQLNQSIQAKAFTTGQDVFFRQGAYDPGSKGGQELIAHELTHVVQQGGAATSIQRYDFEPLNPDGPMAPTYDDDTEDDGIEIVYDEDKDDKNDSPETKKQKSILSKIKDFFVNLWKNSLSPLKDVAMDFAKRAAKVKKYGDAILSKAERIALKGWKWCNEVAKWVGIVEPSQILSVVTKISQTLQALTEAFALAYKARKDNKKLWKQTEFLLGDSGEKKSFLEKAKGYMKQAGDKMAEYAKQQKISKDNDALQNVKNARTMLTKALDMADKISAFV